MVRCLDLSFNLSFYLCSFLISFIVSPALHVYLRICKTSDCHKIYVCLCVCVCSFYVRSIFPLFGVVMTVDTERYSVGRKKIDIRTHYCYTFFFLVDILYVRFFVFIFEKSPVTLAYHRIFQPNIMMKRKLTIFPTHHMDAVCLCVRIINYRMIAFRKNSDRNYQFQ